MRMKELVFSLILLMQACGPLLAQTPTPDPPGVLQRLAERAKDAKAKVQDLGVTVFGFFDAYYEDYIQPVTDSYNDWASNVKGTVWEKIQSAIDDYIPFIGD